MKYRLSTLAIILAVAISPMVHGQNQTSTVWTIELSFAGDVERQKLHDNLLKAVVTKDGKPAPDDTPIIFTRLNGDAMLYPGKTLTPTVSLTAKTKDGTATASVVMADKEKATFIAKVGDDSCSTNASGCTSDTLKLDAADASIPCGDSPKCVDERPALEASVYLGEVVDTFAGDETINYLNPKDSNKSTLRAIGGADFAYRLIGDRKDSNQLWVYGETIHGVRSKDVDCSAGNNAKLSVCEQNNFDSSNSGGQFIAILRGASSLEAYTGLRYEFPPPRQNKTDTPARLFVNLQAGFLTVSGGGSDVVDMHHLGFGALAVGGSFEGSYLEIGVGRNDLFRHHRGHRALIDGYLTVDPKYIPLGKLLGSMGDIRVRPFIEFTGDFDLGRGSDSVQTWFGLDFHLRKP